MRIKVEDTFVNSTELQFFIFLKEITFEVQSNLQKYFAL